MLGAADIAAVDSALTRLSAAADQADKLASDADTWWAPSSSVAGASSSAHGTRIILGTLQAKRETLIANGDHAAAVDFLRSASEGADVSDLLEAAQINSTWNMITTVA